MAESEIDEYIADLLKNNPDLSVEKFKGMFSEALSRKPTLKEVSKFQCAQNVNVPHAITPNLKFKTEIVTTKSGMRYCFSDVSSGWGTLFLNVPISTGVYQWTVQIEYHTKLPDADRGDYYSSFWFGGAASPSHEFDRSYLGESGRDVLASSFNFRYNNDRSLTSTLVGVKNASAIPRQETVVPNHALVSLEVDIGARMMCFFVENSKVPRSISSVPVPIHLGMSIATLSTAFTSVALKKLPAATPSPVRCVLHEAHK